MSTHRDSSSRASLPGFSGGANEFSRVILKLGGEKKLGLASADVAGMLARIRHGFPATVVDTLSTSTGLSLRETAELLGLSPSTLTRKKATKALLDPAHSDRAFRVANAFAYAETVFGEADKALRWMHKPNRAMGGAVPVELLDTQLGETRVRQILTRIEWGAYS